MPIKYIFCISTGRSGTAYLCKLLSTLNDCYAYHEQKPILHSELMRFYLNGNKTPLLKQLPIKLEKIRNNPTGIYADTTHIFIKSFGWELPKFIPQDEIGVIILKRQQEEVVKSTHRIHSGPFTFLGRKWIIVPYKNCLIKSPLDYNIYLASRYILKLYWLFKGQYNSTEKNYPKFYERKSKQLLKWYYQETYALGEKYKLTYPHINYVEVTLDEINTINGFEKIIKAFNLQDHYNVEKLKPVLGIARNLKKEYS